MYKNKHTNYGIYKNKVDDMYKNRFINKEDNTESNGKCILLKVSKSKNKDLINYIDKEEGITYGGFGGELSKESKNEFIDNLDLVKKYCSRYKKNNTSPLTHIIISVGKDPNEEKLKNSVSKFVMNNVIEHGFDAIYSIHRDTVNTHAHIVINNLNIDGYIFRRKKADLHFWKTDICNNLNKEYGYKKYYNKILSYEEKKEKRLKKVSWGLWKVENELKKNNINSKMLRLLKVGWSFKDIRKDIYINIGREDKTEVNVEGIISRLDILDRKYFNRKAKNKIKESLNIYNDALWGAFMKKKWGKHTQRKYYELIDEIDELEESIYNRKGKDIKVIERKIYERKYKYIYYQNKWLEKKIISNKDNNNINMKLNKLHENNKLSLNKYKEILRQYIETKKLDKINEKKEKDIVLNI